MTYQITLTEDQRRILMASLDRAKRDDDIEANHILKMLQELPLKEDLK